MDSAERDRVSESFTRLTDRYRRADVAQTSVGVPTAAYERLAVGGHVDAHVSVRNDAGERLVADEGEPPRVRFEPDENGRLEECLREAFEKATGIDCAIERLRDVAIVTVYDEGDDDREPIHVLETHFIGAYRAGVARPGRFFWSDEATDLR
jgi:hypothetical protein